MPSWNPSAAYRKLLGYGPLGPVCAILLSVYVADKAWQRYTESQVSERTVKAIEGVRANTDALKANADATSAMVARSREERTTTATKVDMIAAGLKANEESNRRREETLTNMLIEMRGLRNDQRGPTRSLPMLPSIPKAGGK